ncbi:MAG TPA: ComF family protein [Candidatus Paceibacterota bacterium]
MGFLYAILDVLFPVHCVGCNSRSSYLCDKCLSDCPEAERESAKWIFPLYDYRHPPVKKAVWILKYKGRRAVAGIFGEILYGRILEELADLRIMENFRRALLIPIPLSRARTRERGYNQAELICRKIVELDQANLRHGADASLTLEKNALVKIKNTEHQARIENRSIRLKNIVGSFAVKNPERVAGRNIILIDDVTTTGATLSEAKKVLKNAGAKKVIAFTVAH